MEAIGVCVSYQAGRPSVGCIVVTGTRAAPEIVKNFDLKTDSERVPAQLRDLAKALNSQLTALNITAAVIRIADVSPVGSRELARRNRLLIEGALALVCEQNATGNVHLRTGKEIGEELAISKKDARAAGAALDSKRVDAAAAALSGLTD